jgi:hypothetical protein
LSGLNQAIAYSRQAVTAVTLALTFPSVRAHHLTILGSALLERYARLGNKSDLNEAIINHDQAVALTTGFPEASYLNNLGIALRERYIRTGDLADLDEAIRRCRQAVDLTPPPSPARNHYVNSLGLVLLDRHDRSAGPADLDEAIQCLREADSRTLPASPDRARYLANLAKGLHRRYGNSGDIADLDQAIGCIEQAIGLVPDTASIRVGLLSSLGVALHDRYGRTSDPSDLNAAIHRKQQAVDLTAKKSPDSPMYLGNLGYALRDRYTRTGNVRDPRAASKTFRQACRRGLDVRPEQVLKIGNSWGAWALERAAWKEAAEAFGFGLEATERLLRPQLLRASKELWLRDAQQLHVLAADAFARSGDSASAVAALEGGRARLLVESMEITRLGLEQLTTAGHARLYQRYVTAAEHVAQLEATELRQEKRPLTIDLTSELRNARRELDSSIRAIRRVPRYRDFFQVPDFEEIQRRLTTGVAETLLPAAAIYLLLTPAGGIALIVHAGGVRSVPLDFWGMRLRRDS